MSDRSPAGLRMTTRESLAWLGALWRPHRGFAAFLVLMTLLTSAVAVGFPLAWRQVIDGLGAVPEGGRLGDEQLLHYAKILVLIAVGRIVVSFYPAFRAWMNLAIEKQVRERVFASILAKDHTFFGRFRTGDLVTRLTEDITDYPRVSWFACSGIFRFIDSLSRVFFCVGAMLLFCDARLALYSMIPVPLMLWVFYLARKELSVMYRRQQAAISRTNDTLEAALSGIRIVKAFNADAGQERRLAAVLDDRAGTALRLAKLNAIVHQSDNVVTRVGQVVVLCVGGFRVLDGTLSLGTLFALHLYLDMLVHPMIDLPNLFVAAQQAFVSIAREEEVLRTPDAQRTVAPDRRDVSFEPVALDGVTFRYRPDTPPALRDVTFTVPRGSRVAVVGAVASGKSTLLRVLAGLLPADEGACRFGGRPLAAWDWSALRARIGYVPQESLLFSDSIEENVAFGRDADPAWIRACLDAAQMGGDLARMDAGTGTRLGRGGTLVSGGQKQRIAIARALAGRPNLLLLDDCTSSLDARNEDRLWDGIRAALPGVTVFVVSHRPATIRRADTILVLERGRLVDSGTHDELSRRCAAYGEFLLVEERKAHIAGDAGPAR
ncbi:MAG: ABC transporter ATP-binding protein/permease [Planctomycetes bacterium]|nr:ABC transporter ATP-binding protein/permease [Planctomycetota bacterium]